MDSGVLQAGGVKVTGIVPVCLWVVSVSMLWDLRVLFVTELADFFQLC